MEKSGRGQERRKLTNPSLTPRNMKPANNDGPVSRPKFPPRKKGERVMPVQSLLEAPQHILKALSKAASQTGTDFDYLLETASRESSFDEGAKASASSAEGLFQFVEDTWLETLKQEGGRFGLGDYARKITQTSDGKYHVADAQARTDILNLRKDPKISAVLAGALTQNNASFMTDKLGRAPSQGELYLAHFLGASSAVRLVELNNTLPNAAAEVAFPAAAKANPAIFRSEAGPRSIREIYELLVNRSNNAASPPAAQGSAEANANRRNENNGPLVSMNAIAPFNNLFSSGPAEIQGQGNIWGTLLGAPAGAIPGSFSKDGKADPLAWAAGRPIADEVVGAKNEAWIGEDGWKVSVEWADYSDQPGSRKNFKA